MSFKGKVAIVTGGASGIGAATVRRFAADGASVVIVDINESDGRAQADTIRADGGDALFERCDVSQASDWRQLHQLTQQTYGRVDVVHNNAYADVFSPTQQIDESDWQRVFDVCLKQVLHSVKTFIADLTATRGTIINTASTEALLGRAGYAAYGSAKGAICSLTRSLAVEYGPEVRVNAVLPGAIRTPTWDPDPVGSESRFAAVTCLKRIGEPEEIASVVRFLASDDSTYVTGQSIVVDGGASIMHP